MEKYNNSKEMSRRGFLKAAALTGAALCVGPTLEKINAAQTVQDKPPCLRPATLRQALRP